MANKTKDIFLNILTRTWFTLTFRSRSVELKNYSLHLTMLLYIALYIPRNSYQIRQKLYKCSLHSTSVKVCLNNIFILWLFPFGLKKCDRSKHQIVHVFLLWKTDQFFFVLFQHNVKNYNSTSYWLVSLMFSSLIYSETAQEILLFSIFLYQTLSPLFFIFGELLPEKNEPTIIVL